MNHDEQVDVTDAVLIIDEILLKNPANFDASLADVNHDNTDAFVNVDRAMFVTVGGERHELLLNGTTSIAQLSTLNSQFSIVYDLQGRKVEKTAKGVYVIDGKKVVIK